MEINFTSIENIKIEDWHHEATRYGEYIAFNGSDDFKEIVYNICLDLENHNLSKNEFSTQACEILSNFRTLNRSFRPASNGEQYDWYIKYFHIEKGLDSYINDTHLKIFGLAKVFENLVDKKFFKIDEILENIPILNKKYVFDSLNKELIEISKLHVSNEDNILPSELASIKDEMGIIKDILESMNKPDSGATETLEERINQLEHDIETRRSEQKELEEVNLNYQKEIGKLRSSVNTKSASVVTFFKSVFPRFELLSESSILFMIDLKDHSDYIDKIKDIYDQLIIQGKQIENLTDCKKINNLKHWYKITITKKDLDQSSNGWSSDINDDWKWEGGIEWKNKTIGQIYLCYFEEHGNQKIFLHAGSPDKLENYDPPRTDKVIGGRLS
jgi:hypothetical protein